MGEPARAGRAVSTLLIESIRIASEKGIQIEAVMKAELLCPRGHVIGGGNGSSLSFHVRDGTFKVRFGCCECGKRWELSFEKVTLDEVPLSCPGADAAAG